MSRISRSIVHLQNILAAMTAQHPLTISECMAHALETGLYSDIAFLVGRDRFRFNVHKVVLGLKSEVFAAMMESHWTTGLRQEEDGRVVIPLPHHSVPAFKIMIKYLYTDEIIQPVDVNEAIEVLELSNFYQIHGLLSLIREVVKGFLRVENCLLIYTNTRLIDEDLSKESFKILIENIRILADNGEYLHWDSDTIRAILSYDYINIQELDLYKALLRWGHEDNSLGHSELSELLNLIRFPTMGRQVFAKDVASSRVLSDDQVLSLYKYFADPSKFPTPYNTMTRLRSPNENVVVYDRSTKEAAIYDVRGYSFPPEIKIRFEEEVLLCGIGLYAPQDEGPIQGNVEFTIIISNSEGVCILNQRHTLSSSPENIKKRFITLQPPLVLMPWHSYYFHVGCSPDTNDSKLENIETNYFRSGTTNLVRNKVKSIRIGDAVNGEIIFNPGINVENSTKGYTCYGSGKFGKESLSNVCGSICSQWIEFLEFSAKLRGKPEPCNIV